MPRFFTLPVIVGLFFLLHLLMAAFVPLVEDEAYYTLWASVPSLGYYDHPPMVAWWIAAGVKLLGPTPLGIRLASVVALSVTTVLTFDIGRQLTGDARVGRLAALWLNTTTLVLVTFSGAAPDAASVLFWTAALWSLVRLVRSGNGNWWLAMAVFVALGVLSKFTNLFFGVGLAGWVFLTPDGRKWLRTWQIWIAVPVIGLILAPYAIWNYQHDWLGLQLQFSRLDEKTPVQAQLVLAYVVSSFLLVSPLIAVLAVRGIGAARGHARVLLWIAAPLLLYMLYHSLRAVILMHWLSPVYPVFAVLAALPFASRPLGWLGKAAAPTGFLLSLLVVVAASWPGKPLIPGNDPFNQTKGWPTFERQVRTLLRETGAKWIATRSYGATAILWYKFGDTVPVWQINEPQRYVFRPPFPADLCRAKGLMFVGEEKQPRRYFGTQTYLGDITRTSGGAPVYSYRVYLVEDPLAGKVAMCGDGSNR